ncbi:MAG: polysaccharide deacetylase family protein [Candidatus Margulisiibacteriota bacterium]
MYHGIEEKNLNVDDNIPLSKFKQHLLYLTKNYDIVSFNEAYNHINGKTKKHFKKLAVLTFDDAYKSVYENAYPLLRKMKIPAIIFVPVNYANKPGSWERNEKQYNGRVMEWDQIQMLAADDLISIGSHTSNHAKLSTLNIREVRKELAESKTLLEAKIGKKVYYFCYPWGQATECSPIIINEVKKGGYIAACSTIWGRHSSKNNIYALRRIGIKYHDSMFEFKLKLNGGFDWLEIIHLLKGYMTKTMKGKSGDKVLEKA